MVHMVSKSKLPNGARIGHVHLKVSDLQRSIEFYCDLLGFELTTKYGEQAAFIAAGGYHHHIGLNTWQSKGAGPAPSFGVGLFHTAILLPSQMDLAKLLKRLVDSDYPLTGAADHGVSEAIYLDDPDGNGVELYWDRPETDWPRESDGTLKMYTAPLDLNMLMATIEN
jgi:catechol 2,3-dioxygenase